VFTTEIDFSLTGPIKMPLSRELFNTSKENSCTDIWATV
jgi:hypothetical protein